MRWRFVDKVTSFAPWSAIAGIKAVSAEEYYLMERLGREGALPESLVVECCAELVRWLAAASSGFERATVLAGIENFIFAHEAAMGGVLELKARIIERDDETLTAECRAAGDGSTVASGRLSFSLVPLTEGFDAEFLRGLWSEIHAEA